MRGHLRGLWSSLAARCTVLGVASKRPVHRVARTMAMSALRMVQPQQHLMGSPNMSSQRAIMQRQCMHLLRYAPVRGCLEMVVQWCKAVCAVAVQDVHFVQLVQYNAQPAYSYKTCTFPW